jgi:hypothetical protein
MEGGGIHQGTFLEQQTALHKLGFDRRQDRVVFEQPTERRPRRGIRDGLAAQLDADDVA